MKLPLRTISRYGLGLSALTLIACFGGGNEPQQVRVPYLGVYSALTGPEVYIHESGTSQTDSNRFMATQSKTVAGDRQHDLDDSIAITYTVTQPGSTLATTSIELNRLTYVDVRDGIRRIRVDFDGTVVTAVLEVAP